MKLYIVHYDHRHGHDIWPLFVDDEKPAPTLEEVVAGLDEYEPDREESVEILGPFEVPVDALNFDPDFT